MDNLARKFISPEEYLELERNSLEKHEYYQGEIFAMAGAKENHNLIVSNLIGLFYMKFKLTPCVVYPSDMRVSIDSKRHYTYPDVSLICGERKFLDKNNDTLLNPSVIIEVLSESTENYDRSKKFESYRKIASLQEYVLVASDRKKIEIFTKSNDGRWYLSESGPSETIEISSVNVQLSLNEVYDKIVFPDSEPEE
jgi:Uma2 family endonuclease